MKRSGKLVIASACGIIAFIMILLPIIMAVSKNDVSKLSSLAIIFILMGSIILSIDVMCLFSTKNFYEPVELTPNNIPTYVLLVMFLGLLFTTLFVLVPNKVWLSKNEPKTIIKTEVEDDIYSGAKEITNEVSETNKTYTSDKVDESVIIVRSEGNYFLDNATINKLGGNTSNNDNSNKFGVNSAILVLENGKLNIKGSVINSSVVGASGVFAYGDTAKVSISDTDITTERSSSRGLSSVNNGYIKGSNVTIDTKGINASALITTDARIFLENSKIKTTGINSPLIYSLGTVEIKNVNGESEASQILLSEGESNVFINNSTLVASGSGYNTIPDGMIIVDRNINVSNDDLVNTINISQSKLSINSYSTVYNKAPVFVINGIGTNINLEKNTFSYGSDILLKVNSSNKINETTITSVQLNTKDQILSGEIILDRFTDFTFKLESSSYTGKINTQNVASNVSIILDSNSTLLLTDDIYVSDLSDADETFSNIHSNGNKIYYDATKSIKLNGRTIELSDGGSILPIE